MGRLKNSLSEDAMDALGQVNDEQMTFQEWAEHYQPTVGDIVERMDGLAHDHEEGGACDCAKLDPRD